MSGPGYDNYLWLIDGCPVLEDLFISDTNLCLAPCCGTVVQSAPIKRLVVFLDLPSYQELHKVTYFEAPSLVYLDYSSYVFENYQLVDMDSLVEASLSLRLWDSTNDYDYSDDDDDGYYYVNDEPKMDIFGDVTNLVVGICNITTLRLSPDSLEAFHFCCESMPIFNNLLNLYIESNEEKGWQVMPLLIKSCPILHTLVIKGLVHRVTDRCGNYCCLGHASLSSTWSAKNKAFHVYDGFHDKKMGREELCCASIILRSYGTDVGIPALVDETVFTTFPWDNQDIFLTNYGRSCDYLFFATPPPIYATIDRARQIKWSKNGRNTRTFNRHDINVTLLTLKTKEKGKFDEEVTQGKFDVDVTKWQLYLYQYSGLSLYCLSMVVQGSSPPTLLPKRPNPKGPKHDENPDPNGSDGISPRVVNPNEMTGKTKPMTVVSGNVNKTKSIRPTEYCSVLDDFGLEKFIKGFIPPVSIVILSDVCGSTLDSHHGFVAEYGKYRDLDLGFHENDSEVTLDVSMGKQYVGRTRYDKHGNTDAKSEVAVCAPSRSSNYVNITLKNIFEAILSEINEDTVESFRSVISESSPGVFVSKMLRPSFCEMMLSKVENFREWVNVTNIQIMSPHTKSKYGIVLEDFGLDSMLMEGFVFPVSKGFPEVCGSTFDSHHGFVVEYGTDRDVDLGFHVNDSETTLSVCLSKQFEGGEGTRCKKLVNTYPKPEEFIRTESEAEA